MKNSHLVKVLRNAGCKLHHHGARHDVWINPANGEKSSVPRHGAQEINQKTVASILKKLGI